MMLQPERCEFCGTEIDYDNGEFYEQTVRLSDGTIDDVFVWCVPCEDQRRAAEKAAYLRERRAERGRDLMRAESADDR